jgi:hypothetical protein
MSKKFKTKCFYLDAESFKIMAFLIEQQFNLSGVVRQAIKEKAIKLGYQAEVKPEGDEA